MYEDFTDEDRENVVSFYRDYCREEIGELIQHYPKERRSLTVDVDGDLWSFDPDLADDVKSHPEKMRMLFEEALEMWDENHGVDLSKARVRYTNIRTQTRSVEEVRKDDIDHLIELNGQISKASAVRPIVKEAAWECTRCGSIKRMICANEIQEPHECDGCERQGPFTLNYHESEIRDHQLIRIKQPPEQATNSNQDSGSIDAHLEGDVVGYGDAGERADIPGVLKADAGDLNDPTLDIYFEAHHVQKVDEDFRDLDITEHRDELEDLTNPDTDGNPFVSLANSIAPGITGGDTIDIETPWGETYDKYWWVRLATGIANLFGSWRRENGDGTYQRGDSHTLLIGDPSTGKSTIMDSIAKISPRSAYESGKNVSGAGLTAAAVNDDFGDGNWSLEAGALVKANNGVACIDEIDKMRDEDLDRLHSALEKQRLEFNKAGIDATLKCETSLLASGNPEGSRFNHYDTNHSQIDIVSSLLDRFDLVFTFKDVPNETKDRKIAQSTITQRSESGLIAKDQLERDNRSAAKPDMSPERVRAWVALSNGEVRPVIKDSAVQKRLENYYVDIRQENEDDDDGPIPATVRTLDGILRLSEASARLRLSDEVKMIDAEMAIALTKVSLEDVGYDPETGKMDADWASGRQSWSQQDRVARIKGLVDELSQGESGAERSEVLRLAKESGIDPDKADHTFTKLADKNELYRPPEGGWRPT